MPIKTENKARYPKDWKDIRARIQARAGDKCEECGVGNHWWGFRDDTGAFTCTGFNEKLALNWPRGPFPEVPSWAKLIEIVCTTMHLDHIPENCDENNLKFACQRCHLRYDAEHHKRTAYGTRRDGKAIEMFE